MYAIIEDGAHQYRVQEGDTLEIQRRDLAEGQDSIEFDRVLMVGEGADCRIGRPTIDGCNVVAKVEGEIKGNKIDVIKFRRRKNYRRKTGHRQKYLRITIEKINA